MTDKPINMTIFDYLDNDIQSFKEDPPTKIMNHRPNSKFAKDYLFYIFENVKKMNDEKLIEKYFNNTFYFGKQDYVPYPKFWKFLISERGCKVLMTVDDFSDFVFVINHHGKLLGGHVMLEQMIFPPGMTPDDYRASLDNDDIKKIIDDSDRLHKLHNYSERTREFVNKRMKDIGIDYEVIPCQSRDG